MAAPFQLNYSCFDCPYNTLAQPEQKTSFTTVPLSLRVSITAGMCLLSSCLETNVVSELLTSNSCFSGSTVLASSKYVTIYIYIKRYQETKNVMKLTSPTMTYENVCSQYDNKNTKIFHTNSMYD